MELIDYIFWGFVLLVVIGGLGCMLVFLPKEHEYEERYDGFYRIMFRDGNYSVTKKKPTYGENTFSLRSRFIYIKRVPFEADAVCDEAKAPDGKTYRAAAALKLCFPEDRLQIFAPTFHGVAHEAIVETLEEALSSAMHDALGKYDEKAGAGAFAEVFKAEATEKLDIFGAYIMHIGDIRISETAQ